MLLTNPFLYRKTLRLEATPKAISVVPNSARLLHRRRIAAQPAGVILAPSAAGLSRTRVLLAQPVAISLAGTASLKRQLLLKCLPATVSLTTTEAILQRTRLAGFIKAEITIEPQPARLLRNLVLKCQPASIDLTPNSANFLKVLGSIEAQPQAIAIDGRAADLRASRLLVAAPATIGVTPRPAQLLRTYPLSAQPVGLALLPRPAILRMSRVLKAVKQDIAIAPKPADLTRNGDPYFHLVQLLLHGDGADGSTTFTDNSSFARTLTPAGNAQIDTAQSRFGGASMLFDGTGDYVICDDQVAAIGTGDVTIEYWVRWNNVTTLNQCQFDTRSVGSANEPLIATSLSSGTTLRVQIDNADRMTTSIAINTWYHIALTRASGVWRAFKDGVQFGSSYSSATNLTGNDVTVGAFRDDRNTVANNKMRGWLDEVRYTVGVARYTANFTVPAQPFLNF
jgi:hypothetical protein